ncbi:MAG: hypothetical protein ACOC22_01850 [bacterium]
MGLSIRPKKESTKKLKASLENDMVKVARVVKSAKKPEQLSVAYDTINSFQKKYERKLKKGSDLYIKMIEFSKHQHVKITLNMNKYVEVYQFEDPDNPKV